MTLKAPDSPYFLLKQILFYMDNSSAPHATAQPFEEARNFCRLVEEGRIEPDGSYVDEEVSLADLDVIEAMLDDL